MSIPFSVVFLLILVFIVVSVGIVHGERERGGGEGELHVLRECEL